MNELGLVKLLRVNALPEQDGKRHKALRAEKKQKAASSLFRHKKKPQANA